MKVLFLDVDGVLVTQRYVSPSRILCAQCRAVGSSSQHVTTTVC